MNSSFGHFYKNRRTRDISSSGNVFLNRMPTVFGFTKHLITPSHMIASVFPGPAAPPRSLKGAEEAWKAACFKNGLYGSSNFLDIPIKRHRAFFVVA